MENHKAHYNDPIELCERDFTHDELIAFIKDGNIIEKQYAVLNLDCVNDEDEAHLLLENLVGVDGKIREAVSLRLKEFMANSSELFDEVRNYKFFIYATIDIDGNVCRNAIAAACHLKNNLEFKKVYAEGLSNIIDEALDEISKFTFRDKKYTVNKQIFKIYWCLEGLSYVWKGLNPLEMKRILKECSEISEYTIREKCAKILNIIPLDNDLKQTVERLKSDENYYVRNMMLNN